MTNRRGIFSRSIREMVDVNSSLLVGHPSPDLEMSMTSFPKQHHDERRFSPSNFSIEDIFERRDSCPPRINKREASYGSLLSILSENSSQTISTCSFDEEPDSSAHVLVKLGRVDDLLYDGNCIGNMNEKLKNDCITWSKKFSHLRIKGASLTPHPYSEECDALNLELPDDADIPETIAVHCDSKEQLPLNDESNSNEADMALMQRIQEKVLAKLVEHLMAVMLEWRAATSDDNSKPLRVRTATASRDRSQPRPLTAVESHRNILPPVIPKPFRPLEGILVISSKVLQNRSSFNYLSRPGSSANRVKTATQTAPRAQLLRNRLSKLTNNLENIDEGKSSSVVVSSANDDSQDRISSQSSMLRIAVSDSTEENSKDTKIWERPFSLPPVHAASKDQAKNMKKSPPVQKLVLNRQRVHGHQILSRPSSGRDFGKQSRGDLESLANQETLPVVVEENFLKIRPVTKNANLLKQRPNSLYPLNIRGRRT